MPTVAIVTELNGGAGAGRGAITRGYSTAHVVRVDVQKKDQTNEYVATIWDVSGQYWVQPVGTDLSPQEVDAVIAELTNLATVPFVPLDSSAQGDE